MKIATTAAKLALASTLVLSLFSGLTACSSLQVTGNEEGSMPVNQEEQREYMKAIRRCHKMGGSRIVKVQGELRCF